MLRITLAGLHIALDTDSADMAAYCRDYLDDFPRPNFTVAVTAEDLAAERDFFRRERRLEGLPPVEPGDAELLRTAFYRQIARHLPYYGAAVFHGSVVAIGDTAYCFTAKSGTGKTTHTRLWTAHIPGAYVVNGDKPIFRLTERGVAVYGTPWAGKERLQTNTAATLQSIVLLRRGQENHMVPMDFQAALPTLLQQCYRPPEREALQKTLAFLAAVGQRVTLYEMTCNMDPAAAQMAYRTLHGDDRNCDSPSP